MLNAVHFSNGRGKSAQRQSVLDLDSYIDGTNVNKGNKQASPYSSVGSLPSSKSLLKFQNDKRSYNMKLLRNLKMSGLRITPQDVFHLRRELQDDYSSQKNIEEKKKCLNEACSTLCELKMELIEEIGLKDSSLPFFIFEYQAFLCWIYSTIRFAGFTSEMDRHFNDMKEHHRILLEALSPKTESFLLAILRFSHICIEYAALCDDEALQWCKIACKRSSYRKNYMNTTCSASSLSSTSSCSDSIEDILSRRDADRYSSMLQELQSNISEIEMGRTFSIEGRTNEKLVN